MFKDIVHVARITIEANSAAYIGTGRTDLLSDNEIVRDMNGMPFIPGTTLAGCLRSCLEMYEISDRDVLNDIFGFQKPGEDAEGQGSRLMVSSAYILDHTGQTVLEGLQDDDLKGDYYELLKGQTVRDHVRINDKGTAVRSAKYDEQVVPAGVRYVFELEFCENNESENDNTWYQILNTLNHPLFRIGAGSRKGFGRYKVRKQLYRKFNLKERQDMEAYLEKSNSLNSLFQGSKPFEFLRNSDSETIGFEVNIKPVDFFLVGAGYGDQDVVKIQKEEDIVVWDSTGARVIRNNILIPASSIKGALRHRTLYHVLKKMGNGTNNESGKKDIKKEFLIKVKERILQEASQFFEGEFRKDELFDVAEIQGDLDALLSMEAFINRNQSLVKEFGELLPSNKENASTDPNEQLLNELFGTAGEGAEDAIAGKLYFEDVYIPESDGVDQNFSHVKIDRFTGSAMAGALFQERAVQTSSPVKFRILFDQSISNVNPNGKAKDLLAAFEEALNDLVNGHLALGSGSGKGHGYFEGTFEKFKEKHVQ